jgi:hypothetical protein
MRTLARGLALALPVALGSLALALTMRDESGGVPEAQAKQHYDSLYTYDQTWNTALRLVRVDLGFKVVEKDDKSGFILFEYVDKEKTSSGSLEFLKGEKSIRVICQIPQFPSYHEIALLDRLGRKLKDEYGNPPEKPKPPPDAGPPPDAEPDAEP